MPLEGSNSTHGGLLISYLKALRMCESKAHFVLLVTRQQQAAKADPRHIINNKLRAAFAATLL